MTDAVTVHIAQGVATLTIDDGKANALSHEIISALETGLDRAEREASAVLIAGRPGRLCAGFDLSVMQSGDAALRELVAAGAGLLLRLFAFPRPVVVACTGHAVAAGALLLLAADFRLGVRGDFKIGLNEVSIGMPLPLFATELARQRLAPGDLVRATLLAELYDPAGAVAAGFLDRLTDPDVLLEHAMGQAKQVSRLPEQAFRSTRTRMRAATVDEIRRTLTEDLAHVSLGASS